MPNSTQLPRQWQIVNFISESKSTHPLGMIFDGIRFGWIFSLLKILWHNMYSFVSNLLQSRFRNYIFWYFPSIFLIKYEWYKDSQYLIWNLWLWALSFLKGRGMAYQKQNSKLESNQSHYLLAFFVNFDILASK